MLDDSRKLTRVAALFQPLRQILLTLILFSMVLNVLMLAPSLYMLQVYDRVLTSQNKFTLLAITLIILVAYLAIGFIEWIRSSMLVRLSAAMDLTESDRIHAAAFAQTPLARSTSPAQVMQDFSAVRQVVTGSVVLALLDLPWAPLYIALLFVFAWPLGVLAVVGMLLLTVIAIISERVTKEPLAESGKIASQAAFMLNKHHRHIEIISALGMIPVLGKRWQAQNKEALLLQIQASSKMSKLSALGRYIRLTLQSMTLGMGAFLVLEGKMSGGMMIAGSILLGRALAPVEQLIGSWKQLVNGLAAHQRLQLLLDDEKKTDQPFALPAPRGQISVEGVSVVLEAKSEPVLRNIKFSLAAGDILAVVGPSASGKSTLARTLLGLIAPHTGDVRLDGADIRQWPREKLGQYVGYLPQDIELFEGTVAENIARFQEVDASLIIAAAQLAHVHDMILRLPKGYDTLVGEGGAMLSGGQRQRLALARAVFGQPRFVVLDEPNSNLDDQGDRALAQTLLDLKKQGTTVIVISHRTSILTVVDKMLLLQEGTQVSFGSREQVMKQLQAVSS
ncbi:type I secretion system permease/ATPase [Moraxellaceae bacterium AER2_44_116]|nr:type I secretion system permease/ATPase [Moraxellaceae bacterium]TQC98699.1 type I secretion system permease/ATPase [Moraxellaceae bacterium AER2_44_116]